MSNAPLYIPMVSVTKEEMERRYAKKEPDFIWREFQSKPITRTAFEITSEHDFQWDPFDRTVSVTDGEVTIEAVCHKEPKYGDFIVKLNDDEVYHCSREVFEARNYLD